MYLALTHSQQRSISAILSVSFQRALEVLCARTHRTDLIIRELSPLLPLGADMLDTARSHDYFRERPVLVPRDTS